MREGETCRKTKRGERMERKGGRRAFLWLPGSREHVILLLLKSFNLKIQKLEKKYQDIVNNL
jgi:lipid A disaccharide synthetase